MTQRCLDCREQSASGSRYCYVHLWARRDAAREARRRHKAAGLCSCGGRPEDGKRSCTRCLEYRRSHSRRVRAERRAAQLCVECATPVQRRRAGMWLCLVCAMKRSKKTSYARASVDSCARME